MRRIFDLFQTVRLTLAIAAMLLVPSCAPAFAAAGFEGDWKVPGDKAGEVAATVTIERSGERFRAVVKEILAEPGAPDPVCHKKCPPDKRGRPIAGLEVMWGLKPEGDKLVDGYLLDPTEGLLVRCQLRLSPDGRTLLVKMYQGVPLLGSTEEWKR